MTFRSGTLKEITLFHFIEQEVGYQPILHSPDSQVIIPGLIGRRGDTVRPACPYSCNLKEEGNILTCQERRKNPFRGNKSQGLGRGGFFDDLRNPKV